VHHRVRQLFRHLAVYGLGDAATSLVSLLLLPVYTRYLSPSDYGVIAMLLTVEAVAKIVFRWGVDTAFMRFFFDCPDQAAKQRLASTLFFSLFAVNGTLVLATVAVSPWLSGLLFGTPDLAVLVGLMLANTFVGSFYFIPFQVLRIRERSGQFISLTFGRSAGTLVARLALVVGYGMGVTGVVVADVIVTTIFTVVLSRWFAPLIRPTFSWAVMRDALRFGLPRIPHSLGQQVIGLADRYFLNAYGRLADVGVYSIGATFGLALKLFLSAFEYAWTPFFLGVMREADAPRVYAAVSTYVVAALALLGAGLCAIAPDLIRLATTPEFHSAAAVTPWIALGVVFQGLYLVGSIGLVITKKTTRYPLATGTAALVSLAANALLIPRHGMQGAAWANAIAYGTLAATTIAFSWRVYPIPYEWGRLARIVTAALAAYGVAIAVIPEQPRAVLGVLMRGTAAIAVYGAVLALTRFFHAGDLQAMRNTWERALQRSTPPPMVEDDAVEMAGEIVSAAPDPDVQRGLPDSGSLTDQSSVGSSKSRANRRNAADN
jgi:O-antigen/teichoic acid export membrane protein